MERTNYKTDTPALYDVQDEPIVLSKPLLDLLLKNVNPGDLIALYTFCYYTAKWQRTNQPKASVSYIAKGLHWSTVKVMRIKKTLIELQLISNVKSRNEDKKITGHYVRVNFIWRSSSIKAINQTHDFAGPGEQKVNALSTISINALSSDKASTAASKNQDQYITPNMFQKFWEIWPKGRKVDKGKSLSKWVQICRWPKKGRPLWRDIKRAILEQKRTERWSTPSFIPHPTTWLNQRRWLDDPDEMKIPEGRNSLVAKSSPISPISIINSRIPSPYTFIKNVFNPVIGMLPNNCTEGDRCNIASGLCDIFHWYTSRQHRPVFDKIPERNSPLYFSYCNWEQVPYPTPLLSMYVEWLSNQAWISDINPSLFNPDGKVFRKFFTIAQKQTGVDFIDGRSL